MTMRKLFLASTGSGESSARARQLRNGDRDGEREKQLKWWKNESTAGGYALTLAELLQSNNDLETINKDVDKLGELLNNKQLYEFLVSPVIDGGKKKSILKTLAEDAKFGNVTLSFPNSLVDTKRIEFIKDILKEFKSIYNDLADTQVANVISAVKIKKPQLAMIAKKIQ